MITFEVAGGFVIAKPKLVLVAPVWFTGGLCALGFSS